MHFPYNADKEKKEFVLKFEPTDPDFHPYVNNEHLHVSPFFEFEFEFEFEIVKRIVLAFARTSGTIIKLALQYIFKSRLSMQAQNAICCYT